MAGSNDIIHQTALLVTASTGWTGKVWEYRPLMVDPLTLPEAYVWTPSFDEERRSLGGTIGGGRKYVVYDVHVDLFTRASHPSVDEPAFRATIDNIRASFRVNQSLNGYCKRFGEQIRVTIHEPLSYVDEPVSTGTTYQYAAEIVVEALEEITA